MMNARLNKAMVALLAVAAAGACDDPPIEPGNSDADRLVTNPSFVVIDAGDTRLVQAYLANVLGNPVVGEVEFEACDAGVTVTADDEQTDIEPGNNFYIQGNTLGESCVNVSGGGFEETIGVRVVPAALELGLADTLSSGETVTASVLFLNAAGGAATGFDLDEVTFESLDEDIAVIDASGNVTAQAPGNVDIVVTLNDGLGAERADTFTAVVEPGTFTGTVESGPLGVNDTITFTAGAIAFDGDERVFIGEEEAYIVSNDSSTTIMAIIPEGAEGEFLITGIGENQVASVGTYEEGAEHTIQIVSGTTFGGMYSGDDVEDIYFVHVPVGETFDVSIDFLDGTDIDAYMTQDFVLSVCADDFFGCSMATGDDPETVTTTLPAGDYEIIIDLYDAHGEEIVWYEVSFE